MFAYAGLPQKLEDLEPKDLKESTCSRVEPKGPEGKVVTTFATRDPEHDCPEMSKLKHLGGISPISGKTRTRGKWYRSTLPV